jgi:hypothetical protein
MNSHSRILLAEADRLMTTTRQRIERTVTLLCKPTDTGRTRSPGAARSRPLGSMRIRPLRLESAGSFEPAGRIEPLEQREDQLRPVGLELGMDAELQPRR